MLLVVLSNPPFFSWYRSRNKNQENRVPVHGSRNILVRFKACWLKIGDSLKIFNCKAISASVVSCQCGTLPPGNKTISAGWAKLLKLFSSRSHFCFLHVNPCRLNIYYWTPNSWLSTNYIMIYKAVGGYITVPVTMILMHNPLLGWTAKGH